MLANRLTKIKNIEFWKSFFNRDLPGAFKFLFIALCSLSLVGTICWVSIIYLYQPPLNVFSQSIFILIWVLVSYRVNLFASNLPRVLMVFLLAIFLFAVNEGLVAEATKRIDERQMADLLSHSESVLVSTEVIEIHSQPFTHVHQIGNPDTDRILSWVDHSNPAQVIDHIKLSGSIFFKVKNRDGKIGYVLSDEHVHEIFKKQQSTN